MTRCIARRITVLASLKMRLEHGVYDVDVVQRVNHVSEECLAWPDNLFVGHVPQHGEDEIVGPGFVAGQHSDGVVSGGICVTSLYRTDCTSAGTILFYYSFEDITVASIR